LALVLLVATGLLTRSLLRVNAVDTGINPEQLVAIQIPMPRALYRNSRTNTSAGGFLVEFDSRFSDLTERLRGRLASVPGVQSVAATTPPPLGGTPRRVLFRKDSSLTLADDREPWSAEWYPVSADYFETVQIPVRQGRTFTRQDAASTRPVAIVNASMAARYWPNENPIGRQLQTDVLDDPPREIVGVVGDRQDRYQSAPVPQVYVPRTQLPYRMDMQMGIDLLATRCRPGRIGDVDACHSQLSLGRHDHGSADARSGRPRVGGCGTGGLLPPGPPRAEGGADCGVARRLARVSLRCRARGTENIEKVERFPRCLSDSVCRRSEKRYR
jgi:hypothetical protein